MGAGQMEAIEHVPLMEQVEARVRTLIQSGQVRPGEKLPTERELCQQLSVGRGTVREALRALQARGYVELKPGRGAFVAEATPTEELGPIEWLVRNELQLRDAIEIRLALEPMAARRMAARCEGKAIRELAALHEAFMKAVAENCAGHIAQSDEDFHSAIVSGSGNRLLISIIQQVNREIQAFRSHTFRVPQNVRNAIEPHSRILRTIQAGDADGAEAAMRAHLDKVLQDLGENVSRSEGNSEVT